MKRRKFLTYSIGALAGVAGPGRSFAAKPCPPSIDGASATTPCPATGGNLAEVTAALSPGQSAQFTANTLQRMNDIQWQVQTIWYDDTRAELQYMGKPATSQSKNYSHYIYNEATDTWSTSGQSLFPGTGHIWNATFDPVNGDYWFHRYNHNVMWWFDRSAGANGTWKTTVSQTSPALNDGGPNFAAMGWHPNLFGPGNPGIFIWAALRFFAFDLASGTFSVLNPSNFSKGDPYGNRSTGQALYLSATDQLICFAQDSDDGGGHPALLVDAGAGNSSNIFADGLVSLTATPPIQVFGGRANHGHVVAHPDNANRLLLLDEKGSSRIWESSDSGSSWQLKDYSHPFQAMDAWSSGEYTVGTIPRYGVIIGMTSNSSGGETVLWKPNS